MKQRLFVLLVAAIFTATSTFAAPVKIIFDTDMDSDCDDAGALACLHAMADAVEVEILATVCSSRHKWSAPCTEAINRYYGRPDLPIGVPRGRDTGAHIGSKYAETIAKEFPGKIKAYGDTPAASEIYRKILASQPDGSVTIVTVGDVTNMRDLLETKADAISELNGPELIRKKVAKWVCMGGRYPEHLDPHVFGNFKTDPQATVAAVRDWPGTIWFTGLGDEIMTGQCLADAPADNPVKRIYKLYLGDKPSRPSWDLIATLFAVRPDAKFWHLHTKGCNHIFENGTNQWREEPDKDHVLIELDKDGEREVRKIVEELMCRVANKSR